MGFLGFWFGDRRALGSWSPSSCYTGLTALQIGKYKDMPAVPKNPVPAAKRTEIANRRLTVSSLYLSGMIMTQIAAQLGVDVATISRDLTAIRKEWLQNSVKNLDELKSQELAKLDNLELEYWTAWDRSCNRQGVVVAGNPAFLSGILSCINKRCEILGLDAPKRVDAPGLINQVVFVDVGVDMSRI